MDTRLRSWLEGGLCRSTAEQNIVRDFDELSKRASRMVVAGGRRLLGITGPPGAGKSTIAARLTAALGDDAAMVGMDAFHLSNAELSRIGRRNRKGAIDTFDAAGYLALLRRLHEGREVVYAPEFRRDIEEAISGSIRVDPTVPLVITEGNYLLARDGAWRCVGQLMDEVWYCDPDESMRLAWLIARHERHGKTPAEAQAWAHGSDQINAELVQATKRHADLIIRTESPDSRDPSTAAPCATDR